MTCLLFGLVGVQCLEGLNFFSLGIFPPDYYFHDKIYFTPIMRSGGVGGYIFESQCHYALTFSRQYFLNQPFCKPTSYVVHHNQLESNAKILVAIFGVKV